MRSVVYAIVLWLSVGISVQANDGALSLDIKGPLTQGALLLAKSEPGVNVTLNGEPVDVTDNGYFVFGFARQAALEHRLVVTKGQQEVVRTLTLAPREYKIDRVNGVPQKTVTPDPKQVKRAQKEAEKVWLARQTKTQKNRLFNTGDKAGGRAHQWCLW
jgi:hypothetical protein